MNQYSNFGPNYNEFESKCSDFFKGYALPVNNATMGLYVAYVTEFKPNSIIGIPTFTFPSTAQAAKQAGMQISIVGCQDSTWAFDPANFHDADLHQGFVITSPFGHMIDFEYFNKLAKNTKKRLVYDLAGAIFLPVTTQFPRVYSFHATKQFPIGEGGCVVFSNREDFEFAKKLINFSFYSGQKVSTEHGTNGKLDEIHSAIGLSQFDNMEQLLHRQIRRQEVHKAYKKELGLKGLHSSDAMHMCVFPVRNARALVEAGKKEDVLFRRYYYPLLEDWRAYSHAKNKLTAKDSVLRQTVAFPSDLKSKKEFEKVISIVKEYV